MHWELLPTMAGLAVRTGVCINGFQSFPTFPAWLGKNSTAGKCKRLTQEVSDMNEFSCFFSES